MRKCDFVLLTLAMIGIGACGDSGSELAPGAVHVSMVRLEGSSPIGSLTADIERVALLPVVFGQPADVPRTGPLRRDFATLPLPGAFTGLARGTVEPMVYRGLHADLARADLTPSEDIVVGSGPGARRLSAGETYDVALVWDPAAEARFPFGLQHGDQPFELLYAGIDLNATAASLRIDGEAVTATLVVELDTFPPLRPEDR